MAQTWLSIGETCNLTGWSERKVQRLALSGQVKARDTKDRAANGRPQRRFLLESLPAESQLKFARRDTGAELEAKNRSAAGAALIPFRSAPSAVECPRIVIPDPQAQQEAEERLEVIGPLLDYSRCETPEEKARWCARNNRLIKNSDDLAQQLATQADVSTATIWRWVKRYREQGFAGLADRVRSDKGQSRWFQQHPDARIFVAYLYLVERTSVAFAYEQLEFEAERMGIAGDLPSRETVRVFLSQSISPAMKTYAREGERAYRERMAPYLKRGYVDVYANQVWVGDHMIHDVEVSNDVFGEVPFGTPGRLRLSAFIDYRSRKAWGTWAWEGSSRSIAATLLRGILEVGPPEHIYADNGKDYKKVAKGATPGSELLDDGRAPARWWKNEYDAIEKTGILGRLGIAVTHCIPRHPQSKHVERFFRTLHERFDAVHQTYTSGSPATRPAQTEELMMRHRWLLKRGRVAESQHPLASQIILACTAWIDAYNNAPHTGEGMDGRTPNEVFAAERNPNQKPAPDEQMLALLMMDYKRPRVRECAVTIERRRYTPRPEDRLAWANMHEATGTEILVAFNATDPEFAAALTPDGHFLAGLECEELSRFAPWDPRTQQQIGQSMEVRRGLEKATKQTLGAIASAARSSGARSAQELLYQRLELPAAVDSLVTQRKSRQTSPREPENTLMPGQAADRLVERLRRKA
jgi:putative transposase